jgi:hypothetical protein
MFQILPVCSADFCWSGWRPDLPSAGAVGSGKRTDGVTWNRSVRRLPKLERKRRLELERRLVSGYGGFAGGSPLGWQRKRTCASFMAVTGGGDIRHRWND